MQGSWRGREGCTRVCTRVYSSVMLVPTIAVVLGKGEAVFYLFCSSNNLRVCTIKFILRT